MIRRLFPAAAMLGALIIAVTLYSWGQPLFSRSGEIRFWVGSIWSTENSQQVADWYTLSHFVQGMLLALVARALPRRFRDPAMFSAALVIGVGWEIVEHTDFVLDRFRATNLYQGYLGDTVLNAVSDYVFMLAGLMIARALGTLWVVAGIVVLEITSAVVARDSLALTTLQVIWPLDAVDRWQQEINPRSPGER